MSVPRPYRITVHNRTDSHIVGTYIANNPPSKGDLLSFFSDSTKDGDPFHHWGLWRIDTVEWRISHRGSVNALAIMRETNGRITDAVCWELDVHVWPEQGPYWAERPNWQKPLQPDDGDEEYAEEES